MKKNLPFLWLLCWITVTSSYAQVLKPTRFDINGPVRTIVQSGDTVFVGGDFSQINYNTGRAALFNTTSDVPSQNFPIIDGPIHKTIPDGNGGWYISGSFSYVVNGQTRHYLAHVLANKTFDPDFDPQPDYFPEKMILSGNTLYVAGDFYQIGGQSRPYLGALDAATGQATSFSPEPNYLVNDIVLSGTTLYVGGAFTQIAEQEQPNFAALDITNGQLLPTLEVNREVITITANDTTIYLGGAFTQVDGVNRNGLAAINISTGTLTSFNPATDGYVLQLLLNGTTLFLNGDFSEVAGQSRFRLAAVSTTTGQATDFNPQPNNTSIIPVAMALSGSTLFVGGGFTQIGGQNRQYLAALDTATGQATDWNPAPDNYVNSVDVNGSEVLVGGYFSKMKTQERNDLFAFRSSTGQLLDWNPSATDDVFYNGGVQAIVVQGSLVYIGGGFSNVGNLPRNFLAAVDRTTGVPTDWNPSANRSVYALAFSGSTIYAGGDFTQIGTEVRNHLAAIDIGTGNATSWAPSLDGRVLSIVTDGSVIYAGGLFTQVNGQPQQYLAAFNSQNGTVTNFNPTVNNGNSGFVRTLKLDGPLLYVGGRFTRIGGQSRTNIAALNTSNGSATSWNPQVSAEVHAIYKDQDYIFAGGMNGGIAVLDAGTGQTLLNPSFDWLVEAVHYDRATSTLYAGGQFTTVAGQDRKNFASFEVLPKTNSCTASGFITREQYHVANSSWAPIISTLTSFESSNQGENFVARIMGYICPPQTGNYTFWISGDDATRLILSTDADPANAQLIAYSFNHTNFREYDKYPTQKSAPVYLEAGKKYYIEAQHADFGGRDHVTVAWQLPDETFEGPIAGARLSPYVSNDQDAALAASNQALRMQMHDMNAVEGAAAEGLVVHPNPFSSKTTINFVSQEEGEMQLEVFTTTGKLVRTLYRGQAKNGDLQQYVLDGNGLAAGVYVCRVTLNGKTQYKRILLLK